MRTVIVSAILAATGVVTTSGLDFDFAGTFTKDNDIAHFNFLVGAPSTVTVFSSSWDDGGFDPILAIWDSAGNLMYQQDDGGNTGSTLSNGTLYDHSSWDSYYSVGLAAGNYSVTIGQYNNFANADTLASGFYWDNNPTFTQGYGGNFAPYFNSVDGTMDTGDFVFHILNVDSASGGVVPDAGATFWLMSCALLALAEAKRRGCFSQADS